jgi:hypothetical protein
MDSMNPRQNHALTHPINDGHADLTPYRSIRLRGDGSRLVVVLAVDR